nr:hypothetical protein [uncultured Sphingobacterium sp.]
MIPVVIEQADFSSYRCTSYKAEEFLDNYNYYSSKNIVLEDNVFEINIAVENRNIALYQYKDKKFEINKSLNYLTKVFKKSEYILALETDWDDNEAISYSVDDWSKSINFLIQFSEAIYHKFNKKIESPEIYHGPNGSIDILWESDNFKLLLNILHDDSVTFYGSNNDHTQSTKGEFNINNFSLELIPFKVLI